MGARFDEKRKRKERLADILSVAATRLAAAHGERGDGMFFYMQERCGAWQLGGDENSGEIEFRIFFPPGPDPRISAIRAAGDFQPALGGQPWDFENGLPLTKSTSDPRGTFWTARTGEAVPAGFYQYKYLVTFSDGSKRKVSDPCARYSGFEHQNAAVVVGGSRPADNVVRPLQGGRASLRDLNLYELMIDDFTDEFRGKRAPMAAVEDKLDYLRDLGFNAILFMPWTAWKHQVFDWGYEPFQYFAVESRYAHDLDRPSEKLSWLKRLISACHDRGIHVIMDGVFNHVSVDFPYAAMYENRDDCPFIGKFGGTFTGLQDLNFNNACTSEFIASVCRYWIDIFGIDGIRFDNTVNFYVAGDIRGIPELLETIDGWMDEREETNFSLTLEHIDMSAAQIVNDTHATSYWDNSLFGLCFEYLWTERIDQRLLNALNTSRYLDSVEKVPTLYLSNHDHSHVAYRAGARTEEGASGKWFKTQPYVIALFTSTASPLVQHGSEFSEEHFLPEDDHNTGRRVIPRPLRWKMVDDPIGKATLNLYGRMARMRRDHPGLRSTHMYPDYWEEWQTQFNHVGVGVDVDRQLAVYHRWAELEGGAVENFVIALNFSDSAQWVRVPFPTNGRWTDLLSDFSPVVQDHSLNVSIPSNWGYVFRRD